MRLPLVLAVFVCAPAAALAQTGGPNAFGYSYGPITYDYVAPPVTALPIGGGAIVDDSETQVALPFSFSYYGTSYSQVWISDNGGIRFSNGVIDYFNSCLPVTTTAPDIAVYWDDLEPVNGDEVYAFTDSASGHFVISWEDIFAYGTAADPGTFQIHLTPSGAVEMHWEDTGFSGTSNDHAISATIGIQSPSGGDELQFSCLTTETLQNTATSFMSCVDTDGDGAGDPACGGVDCAELDPTIFPGALETCGDTIDQDCSGADLQGDADGDTYLSAALCAGGDDCNDAQASINPGVDTDADGYSNCEDCNDVGPFGAFINPGAAETCGNAIDEDCSGADDVADVDFDGFPSVVCGGTDCDDGDATLSPGVDLDADSFSSCDDCDDNDASAGSNADGDGDGVSLCSDCDDADPAVHPGAAEVCDDADTDCDGLVDGQEPDIGAPQLLDLDFTETPASFLSAFSGPAVVPMVVAGATGVVGEFTVGLDIAYSVGTSDLTATLVSPAGTAVTLFSGVGSAFDADFTGTVLSDSASTPIAAGTAPFTGLFQPQSPLATFAGEDPNGTWVLTVETSTFDFVDFGTLDEWTLTFPGADPDDLDLDGWVDTCGDCDGGDDTIYPGAPEVCADGIDQDCNTDDPTGDEDLDTYMDVLCGGDDCDDLDPAVNPSVDGDADGSNVCLDCDDGDVTLAPGFLETCGDGLDQNCDGADSPTDGDGDGYVDAVCGGDDCDAGDPSINPGADADGDGSDACADCEDSDADVYPGAPEVCGGQDHDCDGISDDVDVDGDGAFAESCGGDDCDDNDPTAVPGIDADGDGFSSCPPGVQPADCDDTEVTVFPAAPEVCDDGIDQNCALGDLVGDEDGDGVLNDDCGGDDCDDADGTRYPGAEEFCDGVDHNCDGETILTDNDGDGYGDADCGGPDCDDSLAAVRPGVGELCDGFDNNCDGALDDGGEADADADGAWSCADCDEADAEVGEGLPELCDNRDNDCDGDVDDGVIRDADGDDVEREGCGGLDCDDSDSDVKPEASEDCADEVDDDCDGLVDGDDPDCESVTGCSGCSMGERGAGTVGLAALALLPLLRRRRRA